MKKIGTSIEFSEKNGKLEIISVNLIPIEKELKPPRIVEFTRNVSELELPKKN